MANVLIVEDSQSAAAAQAYSLWESGHTVTFAYCAKEAREYFEAARHQVVLLDFDLPDGTGLDVFRALRNIDPAVCVVMVTGKGDECLAAQILKEGAKDYLTKSAGLFGVLPEVVERVLRERETQVLLTTKELELKRAHEALEQKVAELAKANALLKHEIDERIHTEAALKQINAKLAQTLEELRRSQTQMIQSEKMASVGQLAAGVAHEINNPTSFVSSNLHTLSMYNADLKNLMAAYTALRTRLQSPEVGEALAESYRCECTALAELEQKIDLAFILEDSTALIAESWEGAERIKNIVADLKNFAHPGQKELEYVDINANIQSAINLVWHEIKYKAEVTRQFGELPQVRCYPQMLNQLFLNLLVNAAQAIESKGVITITTRLKHDQVVIVVDDTGKGIASEHLNKIFDPFFTTKPVGQGTGLGLKVVYDIVRKHNGTITVDSTQGVGTRFTLCLPTAAADGHEKI